MLVIVFLVLILANNPLIHSNPFKGAYADTSIKAIGTFEIKTSFQDTDLYSINTGYWIASLIAVAGSPYPCQLRTSYITYIFSIMLRIKSSTQAEIRLRVEVWNHETNLFKEFDLWSMDIPRSINPSYTFKLHIEYVEEGLYIILYKDGGVVDYFTVYRDDYGNPDDSCFLIGNGYAGTIRYMQFGVEVPISPTPITLYVWQWDIKYLYNGQWYEINKAYLSRGDLTPINRNSSGNVFAIGGQNNPFLRYIYYSDAGKLKWYVYYPRVI